MDCATYTKRFVRKTNGLDMDIDKTLKWGIGAILFQSIGEIMTKKLAHTLKDEAK